jgi:MFS transporter, PAT family, beta-lactamase induction signal transducer AmpG
VVVERQRSRIGALGAALRSWRTILSFSSGLPLWCGSRFPTGCAPKAPIRLVGLTTVAQAPWTFKLLWAPLMDRWAPPFLGRRRGWAAIFQVALAGLTLLLAGAAADPNAPWVILALALAIAVAAASQDIALDAYAVDVLRPEEQGVAVGARIALYRAAMFVAGAFSITLAGRWSWPAVCVLLAMLYLPLLLVTVLAPEPEVDATPPATLREAVWEPFLAVLARHRALEILAFVVCYKLADNLAQALTRPFLVDMGYDAFDRGVALGTVGLAGTLGGTFMGGALTTLIGLGPALWWFGLLQIVSNVGYVLVARSEVDRLLMYGATGFESLTSGLGTGAFSVLLLRLTQRRFSATQYALYSSLFALPRLVAGPVSGTVVDAIGWEAFYWITIACGIPGMVLLARFVPIGTRELPEYAVAAPRSGPPLSTAAIAWRGLFGAATTGAATTAAAALLAVLKARRAGEALGLAAATREVLAPADAGGWIQAIGILSFTALGGLFTAAVLAARRRSTP